MDNKVYHACKDINNFGDVVAVYIAEKLTGRKFEFADDTTKPHFQLTGSILREANRHTVVLGTGFGASDQRTDPDVRHVEVLRGPITGKMIEKQLGLTVRTFGDPVIILPELYRPIVAKQYKLGVIPHYIDYPRISKLQRELPADINIIDITKPTEEFIQAILACEYLISSSLHGIVAGHAYGIKTLWVKFSNLIVGDDVKYYDYFASMNIPAYKPLIINNLLHRGLIDKIPHNIGNHPNKHVLLRTIRKGLNHE